MPEVFLNQNGTGGEWGSGGWWKGWWLGLVLMLAAVAAYVPALRGEFVYDDVPWMNEWKELLLDRKGLWRIWSEPTCLWQYYPLTHTTIWLDYQLWGEWTLPYHLQNVLLHGLSAVLFWRLLENLQVPGAWLAGAIFALHPMMVESVAWISERKNVLAQFLYLASLLQYGRYAGFWKEDAGARRTSAWVWALLLFIAALLAKITAYSLPPAILLLCWWKRGGIRWREDVRPVLPFFALAVGFGLLSVWMEKHSAGAQGPDWQIPWAERLLISGRALWFYAVKLWGPSGLCLIYPRWQMDASSVGEWLLPISFAVLVIALWVGRKRLGRGPVTALFFFVGTLLPVLGFLNVYAMLYSFVADRWVYLPSLGMFALMGAALAWVGERLRKPAAARGLAVVVLAVLAVLTWRHSGMFKNEKTLWTAALRQNPACWMAHVNLGKVCMLEERPEDAIEHYRKALALRSQNEVAETNLGMVYESKGEVEQAEEHYQAALRIKPDDAKAHQRYAALLLKQGRGGEALVHSQADKIRAAYESNWGALMGMAWTLATNPDDTMRSGKHAVELAERANEISKGRSAEVLQILAAAYAEAGRFEEAAETARKAGEIAGQNEFGNRVRAQEKLYREGKAYREARADGGAAPAPAPR